MYNQKIKGNLLLLLTALIWGFSFISQSKGVEILSPTAFIAIRCFLGALVLVPVIFIIDLGKKRKGQTFLKFDKTLLWGGLTCGVIFCIATLLQTVGMLETSPGKAGFITALYMVIVPIIGLFTGKRPSLILLISVLIAVCGLYFMCISESLSLTQGDFYVFLCAFFFAGHILAIDYFSPKVDGAKLSFLQFLVCGVLSSVILCFEGFPDLSSVLSCWRELGYSGILSCGVAYTLQIVGQKYTDPTSASILMSLESVFATLFSVLMISLGMDLTGGALTAREILGCILVFAAILLVQLPEKTLQKAS